jgi:hypothetical protein
MNPSTASCYCAWNNGNDPTRWRICDKPVPSHAAVVGKRQPADPHLNQSDQAEKSLQAARALKFLPSFQGSLKRFYQSALLERFCQKRH